MPEENFSLRDLRMMGRTDPRINKFLDRILAETYDDFIKILYQDFDDIILLIQENPEFYSDQHDRQEDKLTLEIRRNLVHLAYDASHETKHGGHTDLLVRKGSYVWIGEAKIHRDYDYLWKGFLQLSTRYSTGDINQKNGGMIIYIFNQNTSLVMGKWQDRLKENYPSCDIKVCEKRPLAFFSTHIHEKSGNPFLIRHMPVMLYFDPKDRI
jgi:hypothetical protein